jgi:hypothetical protein
MTSILANIGFRRLSCTMTSNTNNDNTTNNNTNNNTNANAKNILAKMVQKSVSTVLNYYNDPGDGSPPMPVIVGG